MSIATRDADAEMMLRYGPGSVVVSSWHAPGGQAWSTWGRVRQADLTLLSELGLNSIGDFTFLVMVVAAKIGAAKGGDSIQVDGSVVAIKRIAPAEDGHLARIFCVGATGTH